MHPEVVDHTLISGTSLLPMPGGALFKGMIRLVAPFMKQDFVLKAALKALKLSEDGYAQFRQAMRAVSRRTFVNAFTQALDLRYSSALEKVETPLLLVSGEKEPGYIAKSNQLLASRLKHATARVVPGCDHGWMGESPALFTRVLKAWLQDQPLPGGACAVNVSQTHRGQAEVFSIADHDSNAGQDDHLGECRSKEGHDLFRVASIKASG